MKRQSVFLYAGLAVGLSLLATLLLISRAAFADAEPPGTPVPPEKEKGTWEKRDAPPRDLKRVEGMPGDRLEATLAPLAAGGPDAFGYAFKDSNEPDGPAYNFESISSTGTPISLSDDQVSIAIPINFPFNYYGTDYASVYVSSNGFLSVLSGQDNGCCSGDPFPLPDDPNGIIAGWWGNLDPSSGGTIHYQTLGSAPNRRLIVQFTDVPHCCGDPDYFPVALQYKLFEGTNEIEVHYQAAPSDGDTHSAGIEDESGAVGLEYYRGSAALSTPLAVRYNPPPIGLSPGTASGAGLPDSTVVYTETLINLTGATDSFDLVLSGNGWPATLSAGNTGAIADKGTVEVTVEVDVPSGADPGDSDGVTLVVTSALSPTVYSATATLTTTALSGQYGYVFNPEDDEIDVVDTVAHIDTGLAIDTSPYGSSPLEGALSPDGRWLYASLLNSRRVLVIDATSDTPVTTLPVGEWPGGIAFTADSATAFVANLWSSSVSVIDTGVPTVTATIAVGKTPNSVATSPCLDKVYVTNGADAIVSVIDAGTLAVTRVITGFTDPWDVVISPFGDRAYVSDHVDGTVGVIDTASDSLVDTWDIGGMTLTRLDISPDGRTLYVVDRDGAVTYAVDASTGQVVATIPTGEAWDVEAFPLGAGPFAYVSNPNGGRVVVINVHTNSVVDTISLGGGPLGLALFPPEMTRLYGVRLEPGAAERIGEAGATVVYTETVYNMTGATDSFDLALSGNGWPATLSAGNTGAIADKGTVEVTVEVDVPSGADPGDSDGVTLVVTSALSPTVYSATATLTTTALSGQYGYVFNPEDDEIDVVDTLIHVDTGLAIDTSPYGSWTRHGALSPDGRWLYASLRNSDRVLVVDAATHTPVTTIPVGDGPHGIAFTADSATAFVANLYDYSVSVIDTGVPTVTATIPVADEPTGIATSPSLDKVYVTNQYDGTVSVIDVGTLAVTRVITGFTGPWDVVISPYGHRAYVSNAWDNTVGVIDTAGDSLVDTWTIGGVDFAGLDISPDGRTLYLAEIWPGATYAVDTSTGQVVATIPTGEAWEVEAFPAGAGPFAYVSNPDGGRVAVVNVHTNQVVDTIPLGGRPLGLALFPPEMTRLYGVRLEPGAAERIGEAGATVVFTETVYNMTGATDSFDLALSGNGWPATLSAGNTGAIADKGRVEVTVEVDVPPGADPGDSDSVTLVATSFTNPSVYSDTATLTTTALSGQHGYVFNPEDDEIDVVDLVLHVDTELAIDTSPYGSWPWRGALSPDGRWLYASLRNSDRVLVVDAATHTPVTTIPVGDGPHGIAFTADSATAFVGNRWSHSVSVIDTGVPTVTATIPVGDEPTSIATSPCLGKVYVTNKNDGTVSVIDVGTLAVTQVIAGFSGPWDVAVSPCGDRAYVSNTGDGTVGVIDTAGDSLVGTWDIGGMMLAGLDISPDGHTLYLAEKWPGATHAVDTSTGQVVATVPTEGAWEVEIFPLGAGPFAYVSEVDGGRVAVVNIHTHSVVDTIPLRGGPRGLALFSPPASCYTRTHLPLVMRDYP